MRNRIISFVALAALLVGVGNTANAQLHQSIYLNGNIPTGKFASDVSDNALVRRNPTPSVLGNTDMGKDASVGFGLGYRVSYRFDVGMGEVAPYAGADLFWNMISGDLRDDYSNADYSTPTYFNVPLMAGVQYIYDELPWNDIAAFGEFGVGADFLFITPEGESRKSEMHRGYKPTGAFAFQLGVGAYFGRHVSAGLHYYGLGTHTIDYNQTTLDNSTSANLEAAAQRASDHREKRSVGSIALRIGFHF